MSWKKYIEYIMICLAAFLMTVGVIIATIMYVEIIRSYIGNI